VDNYCVVKNTAIYPDKSILDEGLVKLIAKAIGFTEEEITKLQYRTSIVA
jgi:hypothetical protein